MKVLFVVTAFPRRQGDVITPWLVETIHRLKRLGIAISVFTSSYKGLKSGYFEGLDVFRFRYFLKGFEDLTHDEMAADRFGRGFKYKILSICYLLGGCWAIYRLCRKERFDIVHVHWPFPHILFGYVARLAAPVKLITTFYGAELVWLRVKFPWLIPVVRYLLKKAVSITTISSYAASSLKFITDKNFEVIPFSAASTVAKVHRFWPDRKYILFAGRLVERKGVRYLVDAYRQIADRIPHRLVIVGDGPERENLMQQVREYRLEARVKFTGWISNGMKDDFFRNCSLFVNPSIIDRRGDTEMLGVVQLEAMAFAKPVIATRVGGIVDTVVDEESGLLVSPADAGSLAQAMLRILKNKSWAKQLGKKGKTLLEKKFSWDKIIRQMVEVYEKCN